MIAIRAFVHQLVCQTTLSKYLRGVMAERLSASSDFSQSLHFYYSNHIFQLLSDPLLLDDQLP